MKRILGTMLASRMAGRGRGGYGRSSMLGGLGGRRRGGLGSKLGIGALGYMAYQAYQDHQKRNSSSAGGPSTASQGTGSQSTGSAGASSGGIGAMIRDVAERVTGGAPASTEPKADSGPDQQEHARAAEQFSDDTALLLIRAMITAAYSDGALSEAERGRIMQEIDEAGGDQEDRHVMQREIGDPKPLDQLLAQVHDEETAQEFYLASRLALGGDSEHDRAYLANLRQRLNLSEEDAAEVEEMAA